MPEPRDPGLATQQSTRDEGRKGSTHTHNGRHGGPRHHGSLVSEPSTRHKVLASVSL